MRKSKLTSLVAATIMAAVLAMPGAMADDEKFTVETGLQRLWDMSLIPELRDEKLRMNSSGGFYPEAKDGAEFLYRDTNGEYVLFDASGPGCLVRYWSALVVEGTVIRIYLDGNTEPEIDMPLADMFNGEVYPWVQPIVGDPELSSGGSYSYLPIPFAKGCKVTLDRVPSFYHLEAISLPDYEKVQTFELKKAERFRKAIDTAAEALATVGYPAETAPAESITLKAGQAAWLLDARGAGIIDSITMKLDKTDPDTLRQVVLRAYWDGERDPSVWSPVGDLFGSGFQETKFTSQFVGATDEGFYCKFPMPYAQSAKVQLLNQGDEAVNVEYALTRRELDTLPEDYGIFHARWDRVRAEMGEYISLLTAWGRGKFMGVNYNAQGISPWMLEGDEVVWVDGEIMPSIHGTGTEDYFSGAWYFKNGIFDLATHGAPLLELNPTGKMSRATLYRFHPLDPIVFNEDIRVCIEHGQERSMQGTDYAFTSFWYQEEPHDTRFPIIAAADRLQEAAQVVDYLPRFNEWNEAAEGDDEEKTARLGLALLDDFPNEANGNAVRFRTGQALVRLGKEDEAVAVWRSARDYDGIDWRQTGLCETEAWIRGGKLGACPKSVLKVKQLDEFEDIREFERAVLASGYEPATDFHPRFPDPYTDHPTRVQTDVRMGYDDTNVYFRIVCEEPNLGQLVTTEPPAGRFDQREDAMVIGIDAGREYGPYLFIGINTLGEVQAGMTQHSGMGILMGRVATDLDLDAACAVLKEHEAWKILLRIPRESLNLEGDISGTYSGLMLMRIRHAGLEQAENTMWGQGMVPIAVEEFGLMHFE